MPPGPLAMERLGRLLEDPKARARVEGAIHDLLDRFMQDLRFHQRVVAKLIITEDTVDKVIDTLEAEGAEVIYSVHSEQRREQYGQDPPSRSHWISSLATTGTGPRALSPTC